MKWRLTRVGVVLGALCAFSSEAHAQTTYTQSDVRDYQGAYGAPNNTLTLWGYGRHVSSSAEQSLSQDVGVMRATYLLKFGDVTFVPFDASIPMVDVSVYTPSAVLHSSGLGDLSYFPSIFYFAKEDEATETNTSIAFTAFITAPTGNYSDTAPVNIGDNRWRVQPYLSLGQRFAKRFTLEVNGGVGIATTNNNAFTPVGPAPLKQDPSFGIEAHFGVDLNPTAFVGLSYYFLQNGKETYGSNPPGTSSSVQTLRFTYGIHIEKFSLLLIQYNQDIEESNSTISRGVFARFSHSMFF